MFHFLLSMFLLACSVGMVILLLYELLVMQIYFYLCESRLKIKHTNLCYYKSSLCCLFTPTADRRAKSTADCGASGWRHIVECVVSLWWISFSYNPTPSESDLFQGSYCTRVAFDLLGSLTQHYEYILYRFCEIVVLIFSCQLFLQ